MASELEKLIAASASIENLIVLLEGNPYQTFLYSHLSPIKYELDRQLTNMEVSDTIEE